MDLKTFNIFRKIVYDKSGIALADGKLALVKARVGKRMRALNIRDDREYLQYVIEDRTGHELINLLDAISINVTSFYREPVHFEILKELLQEWCRKGQTKFRIWSAASATGEEPYTLAMTVLEALKGYRIDSKILATDISTKALADCQLGTYPKEKMGAIPAKWRERYFFCQQRGDSLYYTVKPELKSIVVFKRLNLSMPPFPMQGPFDVVFCRNVMIYFDNRVRSNLLREVTRLLKSGGYLMVGHAESLAGMLSGLKTVRPSVYIRP